jgi:hypothetical protein
LCREIPTRSDEYSYQDPQPLESVLHHAACLRLCKKGVHMTKYRNYWVYSIGCLVVWSALLAVVAAKGNNNRTRDILLVFGGWCIGWVSTTIARFVYPPPKRWHQPNPPTA